MSFSLKEVKKTQIDLMHQKLKKDYGLFGEKIYLDCQKKIYSELNMFDNGKNLYFKKSDKNFLITKYLQHRFDFDGFETEFKSTNDEYIVLIRWFG